MLIGDLWGGILDFGLMSLKRLRAFFYRCLEKVKSINKKHFHTELTPTHGGGGSKYISKR